MAIQKFLLNQCTGLPRCARNDGHIELISVSLAPLTWMPRIIWGLERMPNQVADEAHPGQPNGINGAAAAVRAEETRSDLVDEVEWV